MHQSEGMREDRDRPMDEIIREQMHRQMSEAFRPKSRRLPRWFDRLGAGLLVVGFLAGIVGYVYYEHEKAQQARRKQQALDTATELPADIKAAWWAALEQSLKERLVIHGGRVRFRESFGATMYVPRQSINIVCDPVRGVHLEGGGEEALDSEVGPITFPRYRLQLIGREFLDRERPLAHEIPSLPVGSRSPAARDFMDEICRSVATVLDRR